MSFDNIAVQQVSRAAAGIMEPWIDSLYRSASCSSSSCVCSSTGTTRHTVRFTPGTSRISAIESLNRIVIHRTAGYVIRIAGDVGGRRREVALTRPDVDPKYRNHCVECSPSHVDQSTMGAYLIPLEPILLDRPQPLDPHTGVGLALNGVVFAAPAPLRAILVACTLAPFDDRGGHVNPKAGDQYHAVTDCARSIEVEHSQASAIGFSMDDFAPYRRLDAKRRESNDLDACRGHVSSGLGYHYHANAVGQNQITGCFKAQQGRVLEGEHDTRLPTPATRPPPRDLLR